jgi:putative transposase
LEEEVRWFAADRDASAQAAGRPPPKALKPVRKPKLVDEMSGDWDVSIRRACRVFFGRYDYHYKSRRADRQPSNNGSKRPVRRAFVTAIGVVLLRREGWSLGQNKTRRIYRELGLQLRNKTPKRRVEAKLREGQCNTTRPNDLGDGLCA